MEIRVIGNFRSLKLTKIRTCINFVENLLEGFAIFFSVSGPGLGCVE